MLNVTKNYVVFLNLVVTKNFGLLLNGVDYFLAEVYGVAFFGLLLLFWPTRLLILLLVNDYFLYSCSCSTPVFTQKCLFRKGNGQIIQKAILPQRCNCSVVCNISKYLGRSRKRSIANAHALLKVRYFRYTQVVFSYKHTAEYQDLNFHFGHVKLFKWIQFNFDAYQQLHESWKAI